MKKLINVLIISFIVVSTVINLYYINNLDRLIQERIEVLDVESPLIVDSLVFDTIYLTRYDTVRLTKCQIDTLVINDSIVIMDSVDVAIPIEFKHYSDTLDYTAISFNLRGFNCEVDNFLVKNFLNVPTQEKAVKRWYEDIHLGIGLGVTYIDRFRIIPNVGIYYHLF